MSDNTTLTDRRNKRCVRGALAAAAVGAAIAASIGHAPTAHADDNCQVDLWGFLFSQRRTICDGPVFADGSWNRLRIVWIPAHQVPLSCSTYGGSYSSHTTCSGGYFQPYTELDNEIYPVTPETVLQDEPGHLGFTPGFVA